MNINNTTLTSKIIMGLFFMLLIAGCSKNNDDWRLNLDEQKTPKRAEIPSANSDDSKFEEAVSTANTSICLGITDNSTKQNCIFFTAMENRDAKTCYFLYGDYRGACMAALDNSNFCKEPKNREKFEEKCRINNTDFWAYSSLYELFKNFLGIRDENGCDSLKADHVRDACYYKVISIMWIANEFELSKEKIALVDRIKDPRIKDIAISHIASFSETPEYCDRIKNATIKKECESKKGSQ